MTNSKVIKEYKVTCQGCSNTRFFPYQDFNEIKSQETNKPGSKKILGCFGDSLLSAGTSAVCLPLGCCMATDAATRRMKSAALEKMTVEERIIDYCNAANCPECNSAAIKIEVISHDV